MIFMTNPTFSRSNNTVKPVQIRSDVAVVGESKMTAIDRKYIWNNDNRVQLVIATKLQRTSLIFRV